MTDSCDLSAAELVAAFSGKSLSPLECWDALERRIAQWEPHIAALYAYAPERARAEARAATERYARGAPKGPLDGVPATIKEMIATQGDATPFGTAATELVPATRDAPAAARLREAGAILFAKTTAPDYGMLSSGRSSFHKLTRNPWNPARNPGGSSSGAGAAAAAGYGPLHVGTDIGGSIRLPAGWCGLAGLKPSHGRVPVDPFYLGRVAGPMTRSVDDAALMMAHLSRPDARDPTSLPPQAIAWRDLGCDPRGLRIGWMREAGAGMAVEPEVDAAVAAVAKLFADAGAIVEPAPGALTRDMLDGLDRFWRARAWADISLLPSARRARVLPYIYEWAAKGADVDGVEALRGYGQTNAMRQTTAALFERFDVILSPTAPVVHFPAEFHSPIDDPAAPFEHIAFTLPWNMGEQPAISINAGFSSDGMPIGAQIVAPRFDDRLALALAKFVERARPQPIRWPQPPA